MYNTSSNHMNTTTKWLRNLQGKVIYLDVTECSCAYISNCWLSDHGSSDWCITKPNKSNMTCHKYKSIDRTLEMTSNAATNAEKHVTSNIAYACSQRNTTNSVFWLDQIMLCVMTCRWFPVIRWTNRHFRWPDK